MGITAMSPHPTTWHIVPSGASLAATGLERATPSDRSRGVYSNRQIRRSTISTAVAMEDLLPPA